MSEIEAAVEALGSASARASDAIRKLVDSLGAETRCSGECKKGSTKEYRVEWVPLDRPVPFALLHDIQCLGSHVAPGPEGDHPRRMLEEWLRAQPGASFFKEEVILGAR